MLTNLLGLKENFLSVSMSWVNYTYINYKYLHLFFIFLFKIYALDITITNNNIKKSSNFHKYLLYKAMLTKHLKRAVHYMLYNHYHKLQESSVALASHLVACIPPSSLLTLAR